MALSVKGTAKTVASNRRLGARKCLANKACEVAAVKTVGGASRPDLAALAACPVNAACLNAAKGSAVKRKQCYLLGNTAALA